APKPLHFFIERYMDAYIEEMRQFIDAVMNDKPVPVTGADGRAPLVMAEAAWKSVREGRLVRLDEIE
ncbi:MAG: inositol 2-dehydrogenase, partial [Burkholderiales bacterium]|nr:inositol 2-dehydrogenase [Anaerolineae bacterium]